MVTVDTKELKRFLNWRIQQDAVNSAQACAILGIQRPSLHYMRERGDIKGRQWDGEWWYPISEVEKNKVKPGETRPGRPRGSDRKQAV